MENKSLIKLYDKKLKKKTKYELNDFVSFDENDYFKIKDTYKIIKKEYNGTENFKKLNIPTFYKKHILLTKDKNICLIAKYLDIYILIQKYNLKLIEFEEFKEAVYKSFNIKNKNRCSHTKNKNFLISNKQSIELPRDKNLYPSLDRLRTDLGIIILEIPKIFKRKETFLFLKELRDILNKLKIKKLKTNLRIRRIFKYKKNGMFIVNGNTIVIDPRNPKSIIHEIGHYIFENKIPFNLNNKRIYKNKFNYIIKKNSGIEKIDLSKYEDYKIESEIFAYWFEEIFQY